MLKKLLLWLLLIWLLLLGLSAELMAVEQSSIGQKLQQLEYVSKADRFKLINAIKRDMAKLNNQQRMATFGKLRIMIDKRKKRCTNQVKHQQKHRLQKQKMAIHSGKQHGKHQQKRKVRR